MISGRGHDSGSHLPDEEDGWVDPEKGEASNNHVDENSSKSNDSLGVFIVNNSIFFNNSHDFFSLF